MCSFISLSLARLEINSARLCYIFFGCCCLYYLICWRFSSIYFTTRKNSIFCFHSIARFIGMCVCLCQALLMHLLRVVREDEVQVLFAKLNWIGFWCVRVKNIIWFFLAKKHFNKWAGRLLFFAVAGILFLFVFLLIRGSYALSFTSFSSFTITISHLSRQRYTYSHAHTHITQTTQIYIFHIALTFERLLVICSSRLFCLYSLCSFVFFESMHLFSEYNEIIFILTKMNMEMNE